MVTRVLLACAEQPDPRALGGVPIHVAALLQNAPRGSEVWVTYPRGTTLVVESRLGEVVAAIEDLELPKAMEVAIACTSADVVHVHSPSWGPEAVAGASVRCTAGLVLTLHDHALVCPEYRLLEAGERYCRIPDDEQRCATCLRALRGSDSWSRRAWQQVMRTLVDGATVVIAPSRSARDLCAQAHPGLPSKTEIVPWGVPRPDAACEPGARGRGRLRLGVVGVVSDIKGHGRLADLVNATRGFDVEWHLFGASEGRPLRLPRVIRHGAYPRGELSQRLRAAGIDVCVLPSIGPETFSLTHAEILAAGVPALTSNFGALGERVADTGVGWTFDPWQPETLAERVHALASDRSQVRAAAERARRLPSWTEADMAEAHLPIWKRAMPANLEAGDRHRTSLGDAVARARRAATRHRDTLATRIWGAIRRSDTYRDLPIRRALSEERRRQIETLVGSLRARPRRR